MEASEKRYNSRFVFVILVLLMLLSAAYMTFVIKTVPRSVESSRVGPFPELLREIIAFSDRAPALALNAKPLDREAINAVMQRLVPYEGLALKRGAEDFEIISAVEQSLDGRPLLQLRLRHPKGAFFTLSLFAIAKRHFPKTPSFVYKDAWFFQYGKDLAGAPKPLQGALPELMSRGWNMVAANYGNDFYLLVVGEAAPRELATWLFEATTIFSPRK